jgi:beta-galactosidase
VAEIFFFFRAVTAHSLASRAQIRAKRLTPFPIKVELAMRPSPPPSRSVSRRRLVGAALLFGAVQIVTFSQASASEQAPRQIVPLSEGWRFHLGDDVGPEAAGRPQASWNAVRVPHTWNRAGYYTSDAHQRINTAETVNKTQGVGWYQLTFPAPNAWAGKRVWLQFDAASRTAEVWVNGIRLGGHTGGFSRFRFDATDAVKLGQDNVLVVKTDSTKPAPGVSTADILPLGGDFFVHGGLYRPVSLIVTNPIHFDLLDFGGPGVYADTLTIEGSKARVRVRAKVRNDQTARAASRLAPANLTIVSRLVDADGQPVAEQSRPIKLAKGQLQDVEQTLDLAKARLWQGVDDPYLYRLVVELRDRKGQVLDRVDQAFGVRQIRIDPEKGFFLNGRHLQLHGVGLHQDQEGQGWARSEADIAADVALLREMGANTIRLTHYQHGQPIHDLADRYGLILWDEIPLVTAWTPPGQTEPTPGLIRNAEQQLRELIRQNYNHASVATWGVANEVDMGNSLPAFISGVSPDADPLPLLRRLDALAKVEDSSRPITQAACCEGRLYNADIKVPNVAPATELLGVNRYFGWYYGEVADLDADLEGLRAKHPGQPLSLSEYGAGGAISIHTDDPLGGPADSRGRDQPEEYLSYVHEQTWKLVADKPYLWATWLWNSFDFATTIRKEGDAQDINTKGLVTYDRQIRKDAFYFYKANWNPAPTVRITGRRYTDRAYGVTDVRVYSNAPATELVVNGRTAGVMNDCPQKVCVWKDVRLAEGSNTVAANGRFTDGETLDTVSWTLSADAAKNVRIDSGAQVAARGATLRFGSDAFFQGGKARNLNTPAGYGRPPENQSITATSDSAIVASYREGAFSYRVPVANGTYKVTLTFVEPALGPGGRVFDVLANGKIALSKFDVAAAAAAPLTAVTRSFPVTANKGVIELGFTPIKGDAIVSAVQVEPQ